MNCKSFVKLWIVPPSWIASYQWITEGRVGFDAYCLLFWAGMSQLDTYGEISHLLEACGISLHSSSSELCVSPVRASTWCNVNKRMGLCFCCFTAECTDPSSCFLVTPGRLCWVYRNLGATSQGRLFPRAPRTEPPKFPEFPTGTDPISSSPIPSPAQGNLLFVSMLLRKKSEALNTILKSEQHSVFTP